MDYARCTLLNANSWLPLNGKKKITRYFQQYVQDATVIQAENNSISLTEFSNVSGHFMEDVNTPQMDFSFSYQTTVEPLGTDTSLIQTPVSHRQFPMSQQNSHIFSLKKNLYNY